MTPEQLIAKGISDGVSNVASNADSHLQDAFGQLFEASKKPSIDLGRIPEFFTERGIGGPDGALKVSPLQAGGALAIGAPLGLGILSGAGHGIGRGVVNAPRYAAQGVGEIVKGLGSVTKGGLKATQKLLQLLMGKKSREALPTLSGADESRMIKRLFQTIDSHAPKAKTAMDISGLVAPMATRIAPYAAMIGGSLGLRALINGVRGRADKKRMADPEFLSVLKGMKGAQSMAPLTGAAGGLLGNALASKFTSDPVTRALVAGIAGYGGMKLPAFLARQNATSSNLDPKQLQMLGVG